ncbi:MAG: pentapeptide repeat-containing protein, partial [Vicinamibacterales bacterium]
MRSALAREEGQTAQLLQGHTKGDNMKIEIQHRWTRTVLLSVEAGSLRLAVEAAVKAGANLRDADLRSANLRDANL